MSFHQFRHQIIESPHEFLQQVLVVRPVIQDLQCDRLGNSDQHGAIVASPVSRWCSKEIWNHLSQVCRLLEDHVQILLCYRR